MFAKLSLYTTLAALMFAPIAAQAEKPTASEKLAEQQALAEGVKQLSDAERLLIRKFIIDAANRKMQREAAANNSEFKSIRVVLQQEDTLSYQFELQDDDNDKELGDMFAQMFAMLTENTMCQKTESLNIIKTLGFTHFAIEVIQKGKTIGQSRHPFPDCAATPAQ